MGLTPFHVAIPVRDLETCRVFYRDVLGCAEGRSSTQWVDFNFFGHQLVIHEKRVDDQVGEQAKPASNLVDGKDVPIPHYGVVLEWESWEKFAQRLRDHNIRFEIEPYIRFRGQTGEQATMFFKDPSGNALEFKAFKDISQLFAK